MKKLWPLLLCTLTGCTQLDLGGVGKYRSYFFKKTIKELTISQSVSSTGITNLVVRVRGYGSSADELIQSVAAGVASGMTQANGSPVLPK